MPRFRIELIDGEVREVDAVRVDTTTATTRFLNPGQEQFDVEYEVPEERVAQVQQRRIELNGAWRWTRVLPARRNQPIARGASRTSNGTTGR